MTDSRRPDDPSEVAALAERLLGEGGAPDPAPAADPSGSAVGARTARAQQQQQRQQQQRGVRVTTGRRLRSPRVGARQRRLKERRRQRMTRRGLTGTVTLVVLGLVAAAGLGLFVQGKIGGGAATPATEAVRPVQVATLLSVQSDTTAGLDDVTLFALSPDESEAAIVLIPPGLRVEVPGADLASLSDAFTTGGAPLLEVSVANLLGIRFDASAVIGKAALANVFRRAAPVPLDVPTRVAVTQPDGRIEVRFAAGPQSLSAEQLVDYMTFRTSEGDLDRVARQKLGWDAWLGAAGPQAAADLNGAGLGAGAAVLGRVLGKAAAGGRDFQILPVESAGIGGPVEVFQPKREEIAALVNRVLAGAIPPAAAEGRTKVDVRNGNGRIGVSQKVSAVLIPAGYHVVVTGNADNFDHDTTDIVYYDERTEARARDVFRLLGVGRLVLNHFRSGVADITIIVGKDFPQ